MHSGADCCPLKSKPRWLPCCAPSRSDANTVQSTSSKPKRKIKQIRKAFIYKSANESLKPCKKIRHNDFSNKKQACNSLRYSTAAVPNRSFKAMLNQAFFTVMEITIISKIPAFSCMHYVLLFDRQRTHMTKCSANFPSIVQRWKLYKRMHYVSQNTAPINNILQRYWIKKSYKYTTCHVINLICLANITLQLHYQFLISRLLNINKTLEPVQNLA